MIFRTILSCVVLTVSIFSLASCGGGGSSGDTDPDEQNTETNITGPNRFLLFPNPQLLSDGSFETNTEVYAEAYYAAIDPLNEKNTLEKWKNANGFGAVTTKLPEVSVVFGDVRDLGYGRRMTGRQNSDGTVAVMVENYLVGAYKYSKVSLDAAVKKDRDPWHIGTNAIEFSPGPDGGPSFAKFYTFDPKTGKRLLFASLDGRPAKAMPGICINCHGGRADPLTPPGADGKPLFARVENSESRVRGDTQARLHMLNVDHLDFSSLPDFTREDQEANIKILNMMVLCTYPRPSSVAAIGVDECRPLAGDHEWQGTAAKMLKKAYGGDETQSTLPWSRWNQGVSSPSFSDTYFPATDWLTFGQSDLLKNTVHPTCMTCHMQRGTKHQSDIDFASLEKFEGYKDRIKAHVFDRGNMPLAKIVADRFFGSSAESTLANWLGLSSAIPKPGRPIADPGPNRTVRRGPITLSARNSLYANSYSWSIKSHPVGHPGSLVNPNSANPIFTATTDGTYELQLVASKGSVQSDAVTLTLFVKDGLSPVPSDIRFATHIKPILRGTCISCHSPGAATMAPIYYSDEDRNNDADGVADDATDDLWFYKEVRGRINFTDISASPLLRKPSGNHHSGGLQAGFNASLDPGDPGRANYDVFLNWILNGAPQ